MRLALFMVALILTFSGTLSAKQLAVYLSWQKDPTTTMTVLWISKQKKITSAIEYAEMGSANWVVGTGTERALPGDVSYKLYTVELRNLKPNCTYCFRILGKKKVRLFRTMPQSLSEPISFVVGGDTNHAGLDIFKDTNRVAAKTAPYFAILGGDLAYACKKNPDKGESSKEWLNWIEAYSETMITPTGHLIPLLVTIGNHDVPGEFEQKHSTAEFFYTLFPMPGLPGYNTLRFGNYLSLYLLDTNHTNPIIGMQRHYLEQELSKDGHMQNRFAVYHVPAYPSKRKVTSEPTATIQKHWVPIFEKYNLHAAFENHDHGYKRTYPLRNGTYHPKGIIYLGDGSWGTKFPDAKQHPLKSDRPYIANFQKVRQFLFVELSQAGRKFSAINEEGQMIDQYSQTR